MKQVRAGLWLIAVGIVLFTGAQLFAEEIKDEKEWEWGCQIRGRSLAGECVMRKFTKVGEADNDVDTDEPQVLGFEPGNVPISKDGKPIFSRLKEYLFLKRGEVKLHSASKCQCK